MLQALTLDEVLHLHPQIPRARSGFGAAMTLSKSAQQHGVEPQPDVCQEVEAWIKGAGDRRLALLVCPELLRSQLLQHRGLHSLSEQPVLVEQIWLELPHGTASAGAGRSALQGLCRQFDRPATMQDLHEI
jgi:hypothetical protein